MYRYTALLAILMALIVPTAARADGSQVEATVGAKSERTMKVPTIRASGSEQKYAKIVQNQVIAAYQQMYYAVADICFGVSGDQVTGATETGFESELARFTRARNRANRILERLHRTPAKDLSAWSNITMMQLPPDSKHPDYGPAIMMTPGFKGCTYKVV
jgi:hypothetical protein